ncbi:MAG: aminotransferase class V-fold PLP-dependent enzyme [Gemmatimonadota bacterium]
MNGETIASVRAREYPNPSDSIFLNTASWGLLPASVIREATELLGSRNRADGVDERELGRVQHRCRGSVAKLLHVTPEEIALAPNTSFGVNLAVALVAAGPPGIIVLSEGEFPANVFPWQSLEARGFTLAIVPADHLGRPREEALANALDRPGVRALALSAVQFASGYRADLPGLGSVCRSRNILFCVDAIQALGAVPLHPREASIDILASGGQKWLCGPWGSGFAYVRRELLDAFEPPMVSWLAVKGGARFDDMLHYRREWLDSARRFELATLGIQDYVGLARSVEILLEMGVEEVRRHIHGLHEPVVEWILNRADVRPVTPLDPERRAGILSFIPRDLQGSVSALEELGVIFGVRQGAIRLAPHFYTTREEMDRVVEALDRAC